MIIKYLHWVGLAACVTLIVSCFLSWSFHADINQTFTGFYSYKHYYGKPGFIFIFFALVILVFMLLPKIWAKRANLFMSAFMLAFAVRTFIVFGACYNNYCPQKMFGLYLMLSSTVVIMLASVFPKVSLMDKK